MCSQKSEGFTLSQDYDRLVGCVRSLLHSSQILSPGSLSLVAELEGDRPRRGSRGAQLGLKRVPPWASGLWAPSSRAGLKPEAAQVSRRRAGRQAVYRLPPPNCKVTTWKLAPVADESL